MSREATSVSVIIPTYNSGALVVEAVHSALNQSAAPHEVIVVDDGSHDDTESRLRTVNDRVVYIRQENAGVAVARNTGIARATGDYVAFLDADDFWHPLKLERQVRALNAVPGRFGALGTDTFDWPVAELPHVAESPSPTIDAIPWSRLAIKNWLTTSSILVKRTVLNRAGLFDSTLRGPEDHDMWLRIAEIEPIGVLREPLTGYRDIQGSLSKHAAQMERGMVRILDNVNNRGGWRGRKWLQRAARGYVDYSSAYMYAAAGEPALAVSRLTRSLMLYPLPYRNGVLKTRFARLKLMAVVCRSLFGPRSQR